MSEDQLTAVMAVPGHSELIELHFETGAPLRVPLRVFVDSNCKLGMAIPFEVYEQLQNEAAKAEAKERILKSLSRRSMTIKEVEVALSKQGVSARTSQSVIEDLLGVGLLNDGLYAAGFASSKARRFSRAEVVWKLSQHGISRDVAEAAVRGEGAEAREYEAALNFGNKFWRRHERDEPRLRAQKLGSYLQRRGFSLDTIRRVLQTLRDSLS